MNYHMIRTDDMLNGDGLRVIIFVSGCGHHCEGCHNPETWDKNSGNVFTPKAAEEIVKELEKNHISGVTFSGGDPLHEENVSEIYQLVKMIKNKFPNKTIWLYTGYTWEQIHCLRKGINEESQKFNKLNHMRMDIVKLCDVVCDGKFVKSLADVNCPWVGSTNQRVIDVKETLKEGTIICKK